MCPPSTHYKSQRFPFLSLCSAVKQLVVVCWHLQCTGVQASPSMLKTLVCVPDNLSPFYKRTVKTGLADNTHHTVPALALMTDIFTSSDMFCFSNCVLDIYYQYDYYTTTSIWTFQRTTFICLFKELCLPVFLTLMINERQDPILSYWETEF